MTNEIIKKISFYSRSENSEAKDWQVKIELWLKEKYPEIVISNNKPEAILVLGGDGTIMEAVRKYANDAVIIFGINLGQMGFLASVNNPEDFPSMLGKFLRGDFETNPGMIIRAEVMRDGKSVFAADAFNEIVVQNPLGIVEIGVGIGDEMIEEIRGSGVLVATPSGSTAYNLSAHGPVVAPDIQCLILTELFDHDLPTPSLVVPVTETIKLVIRNFREHKFLKVSSTNEPVDVLLIADGAASFVLTHGDEIRITRTESNFRLVVLEPNYFYKNLRSKFSFK